MAAERRTARIFLVVGILLLVGSLGVAYWWWNRPAPPKVTINPEDAEIVCTGRVDIPGQVISLEPSQAGRIIKVCVAEGATVKKDDEILHLDSTSAIHRLAQANAAAEVAKVEEESATKDVKRFPKQMEARESLVKASSARREAAEKMLEQRKAQSSLTPLGKAELEAMDAQIRELKLIEEAQKTEYEDLGKLDPQMRVRVAKAKLQVAEADKALAQRGLEDCIIRAPSDGTILRLSVAEGGVLVPGGYPSAIIFAPKGKLIIRAEIEQEHVGIVKEGMSVTIQDENQPDAFTRTGKIKALGKWIAQRRSVVLEPGEINDVRTMECIVEVHDGPGQLVIGQRMRVRVKK